MKNSESDAQISPARKRPILLSNESPILTITRSSLNRLNEQIKLTDGKAAHASVPSGTRCGLLATSTRPTAGAVLASFA